MIIGCPKCGFEQPEIEYCANCGVNIHAFKPKKKPLKDRLLKNSYFYLSLILVILIGTLFFVKENWFPSEKRIYTFVPASYQETLSKEESTWAEDEVTTTAASADAPRAPASKTAAVEKEQAPKLEVYAVSIPISSLAFIVGQEITADSLKTLRSYGVRKPLEEKDLNALEDTTIPYKTEYVVHAFQEPLMIHQTIFDPQANDDIGFILSASIDSYKNHQVIFTINLKQNFYVDKAVQTEEQDLKLEIGEKQSRIITGILPHKPLNEREKTLLQGGYLGLMNSPEFQSGDNTFVLVLTYKY
jgi:hypothetical protein